MTKITILTACDQNKEQYWFAKNEQGETFSVNLDNKSEFRPRTKFDGNWYFNFNSIETLKSILKRHFQNKKLQDPEPQNPKIVETLEF